MIHDPLFFINSNNFGVYNRILAKIIGLLPSIFLCELIQKRNYHSENNELINSEKHGTNWFYYTVDSFCHRTTLSRKEQESCVKILTDLGLIQSRPIGLPARRCFRLNDTRILQLFNIDQLTFTNDKHLSDNTKKQERPQEPSFIVPKGRTLSSQTGELTQYLLKKNTKEKQKENTHALPSLASENFESDNFQESARAFLFSSDTQVKKVSVTQRGAFVKLTDAEYDGLCYEYGRGYIEKLIAEMNDYCSASNPKGYRDYAAALRQWIRRREKSGEKESKSGGKSTKPDAINVMRFK